MTDTSSLERPATDIVATPRLALLRSLFPFVALGILLGTLLWGPWVSLALVALWWNIITRIA